MTYPETSGEVPRFGMVGEFINAEEFMTEDQLQILSDIHRLQMLEEEFGQETSSAVLETRLRYAHDLRTRMDAAENVVTTFAQNAHDSYKTMSLHGARVAESNARVAYGHYIDALFAMQDQTPDALRDALIEAIAWADYSQRQFNESKDFAYQVDVHSIGEYIGEVLIMNETFAAKDMLKAIYNMHFHIPTEMYLSKLDKQL